VSSKISNDAVKARREYHREWRQRNKQRIRAYNARFWERKALEKNQTNLSEVALGGGVRE
jgi:hypothetical protein